MITFQQEPFAHLIRDGQAIFQAHYDELAVHKDQVPLGMDFDLYLDMEKRGVLHSLTARKDGQLIGYYIALIVSHHPHNKDAGPVSTTDMFYIASAHRKGGAGAKLLMAAEKMLRAKGVQKATISTKVKMPNKELLEALGWENTDIVFQKVLA
jgi:GNAT superfamily N-acetyltransferase